MSYKYPKEQTVVIMTTRNDKRMQSEARKEVKIDLREGKAYISIHVYNTCECGYYQLPVGPQKK